MGHSQSKEEVERKQKEKLKKEKAKYIYDRRKIGWDEFGNLRYGIVPKVKPSNQLKTVIRLEAELAKEKVVATTVVDDKKDLPPSDVELESPTTTWNVISAAWITSWLAYVHVDKGKSPSPGPCRNDHLIEWDPEHHKYIGRFGLQMSTNENIGDYRRIHNDTWEAIKEFYPGSGPSITMEFDQRKGGTKGFYDTSTWTVLDHPPPDDNSIIKKKKRFIDLTAGFHRSSISSPVETEAAEMDDNTGAIEKGKGNKTPSKSTLSSGKYVAVDRSGEGEQMEYEEDEDEDPNERKRRLLAMEERIPDSDDDDLPEDGEEELGSSQPSFQAKTDSQVEDLIFGGN
mmetsp:Transcript_28073/g.39986  ORF Transcript_28073/g.39986 Transcript_28073/m.39986 type:complete len:342 (-) Transcript_28073:117-1142(-)